MFTYIRYNYSGVKLLQCLISAHVVQHPSFK